MIRGAEAPTSRRTGSLVPRYPQTRAPKVFSSSRQGLLSANIPRLFGPPAGRLFGTQIPMIPRVEALMPPGPGGRRYLRTLNLWTQWFRDPTHSGSKAPPTPGIEALRYRSPTDPPAYRPSAPRHRYPFALRPLGPVSLTVRRAQALRRIQPRELRSSRPKGQPSHGPIDPTPIRTKAPEVLRPIGAIALKLSQSQDPRRLQSRDPRSSRPKARPNPGILAPTPVRTEATRRLGPPARGPSHPHGPRRLRTEGSMTHRPDALKIRGASVR
jgi:hypothetical protein